jgi:hypothetical protein
MGPGYEWRRETPAMRHHLLAPIAVAATLMIVPAGCPSGGDECVVGSEACPCTSAGACDPGLQCHGNRCLDPRKGGIDTADGGVSARGRTIGAACAQVGDCNDGLCLNPQVLPGGYCSKPCGGELLSLGDCPAGSACTQLNEASSMCMALCGPGSDPCRAGYACSTGPGAAVCLPRCQNDRSCRPGFGCNPDSGLCELGGSRERGRAGTACSDDSQCASNLCLSETISEGRFPGGYCTRGCSAAEEDKPCAGNDGVCIGVPRDDGTKTFLCFGGCTTGVDCRGQYFCSADISVRTADGLGVCVPRCEKLGCREGFSCDPSVGACTMGGDSSGPAMVDRQDLGVVTLSYQSSDFKTFTIDVPPTAVSFSVIAEPLTPGQTAGLVRITTPSGQVVHDFFDPTKTAFRKPSSSYVSQPLVMIYPNAPRVNIAPGKYQVVLATSSTTPVQFKVTQLIKRQSGVLTGGNLPLTFWFTRQKTLNAQTAQTDPRFQAAVAIVTEIYAAIGVKIGPISYVDLGPESEALAVVQDRDDMGQLFSLGKSNAQALNYYFIEQFNFENGAGIIGISGGIPGPVALPGLARGGVAVALSVLERTETLATAMAHEGGHYLGLFHTSERTGRSFDPLLDTPECPISNDADADMKIDSRECAGKGADNLMFWQASGNAQRQLTNDQRFVLLRNPVLQ